MISRSARVRLPIRLPYDAAALFSFLGERALPGVETVRGTSYARTIQSRGRRGILRVSFEEGRPFLSLDFPAGADVPDLVRRTGRIFDVDADPAAIRRALARDPVLAPLVAARPGLRVPGAWDPFELAVRAILGQQVSVRGARTLAGRLVARFGRRLPLTPGGNGLSRLFPSPAALASADLSAIGLPRARARAIRSLAGAVRDGRIAFAAPLGLEDFERRLTALPGIGPWTAQYVALRALGEPDAFPAGDIGLRRAVEKAGALSRAGLPALAERWRPYRAYATMHLWTSVARITHEKETR